MNEFLNLLLFVNMCGSLMVWFLLLFVCVCFFVRTISQKPMQLGSPKTWYDDVPQWLLQFLESRGQGHMSQKHCRRGSCTLV